MLFHIPPPPDAADDKDAAKSPVSGTLSAAAPSVPYSYPPTHQPKPAKKRRFAFLRRNKKTGSGDTSSDSNGRTKEGEPKTWEDSWVPGDYPFVRLEGNRAACAICLMDFEEPKRVEGVAVTVDPKDAAAKVAAKAEAETAAAGEVQEVRVDEMDEMDEDEAGGAT